MLEAPLDFELSLPLSFSGDSELDGLFFAAMGMGAVREMGMGSPMMAAASPA